MCLFANHHKSHSQHIPTFVTEVDFGCHEDMVTCYHAFVGCLVTTPRQMPSQSLFSTLLASSTILSCSVHLPFSLRLENTPMIKLDDFSKFPPSVSSIQWLVVKSVSILRSLNETIFLDYTHLYDIMWNMKYKACYVLL